MTVAPSAQLALRMALLAPQPGIALPGAASADRASDWAPSTPPPPGQNDPLADLPAPPTIPGLPDPRSLPPPLPRDALPGATSAVTPMLRDFPSLMSWGGMLALSTAGGSTSGAQAAATMLVPLIHGMTTDQHGTSGASILSRDLTPLAQAMSGVLATTTPVSTLAPDDPRVQEARGLS